MTRSGSGKAKHFPLAICAFAVLVRVLVPVTAYLFTSDPQVFHSRDTNSYIEPTQELLSGGTFSVNGKPQLHRTPGYSLILAPGIAANHVEVVTIALQILLSASSVWLVFVISLEIFSSYRAALIAAWLYAIEPLSVLYTSKLLTETWFTTLLLVSMYFLIRHLKLQRTDAGPVTKRLFISAVALSGAAYVRPVSYFLPICIFLGWVSAILLGYWAKRVGSVVVKLTSALGFIIVSMSLIAAWQVRNYVQTGYSGFSGAQDTNLYFYLGAATLARIEGRSYYDVQESLGYNNDNVYFSKHPEQKTWSEAQVLRFKGEEGRRILLQDPLTYLKIYSKGTLLLMFEPGAVELLRLFKLYEEGGGLLGAIHDRGIISVSLDVFERNPLFFWSNVVFSLYLFAILGLAVVGLARGMVRTRTGILLLVGATAYLIAISAGPQSYSRFRHPIMPFLCILAGVGMTRQKAVDMAPQRNLKRVKKTTGGAGGQPAPAAGGAIVVLPSGGLAPGAGRRALTAAEFQGLSAVPLEAEWFANIDNPRTRRGYRIDIHDFMGFVGIAQPEEFRTVTRAHVLAWRKDLEGRELGGATIRRKLAALSSLFEHLCDANAVTHNPVKGVKRPKVESYEGRTPALGDGQARALLDAPGPETEKGKRDRAILSVLLYHGLRREELCTLKVRDIHQRRGVLHLRVHGKGGKVRYLPLHPGTGEFITDYLDAAGHGEDLGGALFRPVKNNTGGTNGERTPRTGFTRWSNTTRSVWA